MLWTAVSSVGLPKPVWLVLVASALAYFVAPVIFFYNLWYVFTVIPKKDKIFYPNTFQTYFAWFSCAVFGVMTALMIAARVFKINLGG